MSLSDLASIGSFVSGAAVLISLIYLALQVRQAEKNQRALMQQGRAALMVDRLQHLADPQMNAVAIKVISGDPQTTYAELRQFQLMFRATLYVFEDAFFQHQQGLLDARSFQSTRGSMAGVFALPAYRAEWKRTRHFQEETFRNFLDGILRDTPVMPVANETATMALWRTDLAAELAAT
jgi:hypothetical protein